MGKPHKATEQTWDLETDVVVIGLGGAGVAAAIEAADRGAEVMAFDRFGGGGATRKSGGVMYSGGGTDLQKKAGYDDTPENMLDYMRQEAGDVVPADSLKRFCDESVENFDWVRAQGVPYPFGYEPEKTFYPANETTLYYSGNEPAEPYSDKAVPAPRGHRAAGKGLTGKSFYDPLRKSAEKKGVKIHRYARCLDLVRDADGAVIGAEIAMVRSRLLRAVIWINLLFASTLGAMSGLFLSLTMLPIRICERFGKRVRVRARGGVVLAAGGFIFNRDMAKKHLPYAGGAMRLGTAADDGSGIRLGHEAGGELAQMDRSAIWLFFAPPRPFLEGIFVDRQGNRICNETYYGATLAMHMVEKHDARALLVIDSTIRKRVRAGLWGLRSALVQFIFGTINLYFNRKKAPTLAKLARKCGADPEGLEQAVKTYNADVEAGRDAMGKFDELLRPIVTPPFYAVNCDIDNWRFLTPAISLGGLVTDVETARVLDAEQSPIPGLYAVGRNAVGICSQSYVTGLAIADCIFSGRNAGRNAAADAGKGTPAHGQ